MIVEISRTMIMCHVIDGIETCLGVKYIEITLLIKWLGIIFTAFGLIIEVLS